MICIFAKNPCQVVVVHRLSSRMINYKNIQVFSEIIIELVGICLVVESMIPSKWGVAFRQYIPVRQGFCLGWIARKHPTCQFSAISGMGREECEYLGMFKQLVMSVTEPYLGVGHHLYQTFWISLCVTSSAGQVVPAKHLWICGYGTTKARSKGIPR